MESLPAKEYQIEAETPKEEEKPKEESNETKDVTKKEKIKVPKRKYAIIHGYNGHDFCGNQKNKNVRTVEGELETSLYNARFISECNYGNFAKIGWMRASRTDKGVSAVMNVVSCKLHKYPEISEKDMKQKLNDILPKDIHIFRFIEMSEHFDSKENNNHREYHYILPSFMLEPKTADYKIPYNQTKETPMEEYKANYEFKLSPELHDKVKAICKAFVGTKKYHNYTKKVGFSEAQSVRHIYEMNCDEIINYDGFEAIKFKIVGQSFLYNQIRKMIGMVIDLCRECKDMTYFTNSFLSNKVEIPKAPAEGLYLRKIDYSKYNDRKLNKKNNIFLTEDDEVEMEEFSKKLISEINKFEVDERAFSKWQWRFDNVRDHIY